jgi:hypothetical protein
MAKLSENDLLAISDVFGHPKDGLTQTELRSVFETCGIPFKRSLANQTQTIHQTLKEQQARDGHRRSVLAFLRVSMNPARYEEEPDRYSRLREQLNDQLKLCGLRVERDGSLSNTEGVDREQAGLLRYMIKLIRGLGLE